MIGLRKPLSLLHLFCIQQNFQVKIIIVTSQGIYWLVNIDRVHSISPSRLVVVDQVFVPRAPVLVRLISLIGDILLFLFLLGTRGYWKIFSEQTFASLLEWNFDLEFVETRGIWRIRQITAGICRICQILTATLKIKLNCNFGKFAYKAFLKNGIRYKGGLTDSHRDRVHRVWFGRIDNQVGVEIRWFWWAYLWVFFRGGGPYLRRLCMLVKGST